MNRVALIGTSSPEWIATVLGDFDTFLSDHTDCERKAAATALSLISRFPEYPVLVEPMVSLAREELAHFHRMYRICKKRGTAYTPNQNDPYISRLRKMIRHPEKDFFLDRLLTAAIIEARAHERLAVLSPHIPDESLKKIYEQLAKEEEAHESIFLKLAENFFSNDVIAERLRDFEQAEGEILQSLPLRAAIH